jgi:hypothetical protein
LLSKLSAYLRLALLATPLLLSQCGTDTPEGPDASGASASGSGNGGAPDGNASGGSDAVGKGGADDNGLAGMAQSIDETAPVFAGVRRAMAVSATEINLTWDPAKDAVTPAASIAYRVYLAESGSALDYDAPFSTTPAGASATTLGGLRAGITYDVAVRAVDLSGNEDQNINVASATTPDHELPVFGGVTTAESTTPSSVTLTWAPAADNATPAADIVYEVFMSGTQGGEDFDAPLLVTEPGATQVTIGNLDDATGYFFVVRAVDAGSNSDKNRREISTFTKDGTPPVFAGAESATALGTAITVEWNPASDNLDPPSYISYRVYQSTTSHGQVFTQPPITQTPKGVTKVTIPDLNVSTQYYYVVRAVDSTGNEDGSVKEVAALTAASPDVTPPVFAGLASMTALSATSLSLQWAAATDDFSAQGDLVYDIYLADSPGAEFFGAPSYTSPPGATSYVLSSLQPLQTVYAVVRARDLIGHSDSNQIEQSAKTLTDTSPPAFAGLASATPTGTQTALLTWLPAQDDASAPSAMIYKIYLAASPGAQDFGAPVASSMAGATQIVVGALLPDQDYYFVARAFDAFSNHDSNLVEKQVHTDPDTTAPTFAGATSASGQGPTSILVSWSPASDDVALSDQIQYEVYVAASSGSQNFSSPVTTSAAGATSALISGLAQDKAYYFVVRARDPYGNVDGNTVEVTDKTFPDTTAPTFAGASSVSGASNTTLTVNWSAADDDVTPAAAIDYLVCWSQTNGGCASSFVTGATVTGGTSYQATALSPNTPYYFLVRARDAVGNTDVNTTQRSAATTVDVTPPTFAGVTSATALTPKSIRLNWTQGSDNAAAKASLVYEIYVAAASGAEDFDNPSFTSSAGVSSYTVTGLTPNTPYYFSVRARDPSGNRDSNVQERTASTLKDTTAPVFTGAGTIDQVTETSMRVSWTAATDDTNQPSAITYQVCVGKSGDCTASFSANYSTLAGATSQVVSGLSPSTTYYIVVRATDSYGNQDANSTQASKSTLADPTAPVFAGASNVSGATDTQLTVNWSDATDNVTSTGNISYQICRSTSASGCSGASFSATQTVTGVTSYQFTSGLAPTTTYYFVVRAFDEAGLTDGNSNVVSGATINDTTKPTFAGLVSATQAGATSIDLSWSAASDNVSTPAQIVYDIYQASSANGESYVSASYTTAAGDTAYTVNGLSPTTPYYFVVRARDQAGNRDTNTTEKTATTAADTTPPSFAGVTGVSNLTASTADLTWGAASDNVTPPSSIAYDICVTTSNGGCANAAFNAYTTSSAGATSMTVTGLTPLTSYYFVVRARDAAAKRDANNVQVSGTTKADTTAPTFAGATSVDNATITQLRVNWAAATDNAPGSLSYDVCYTLTSGACDNGGFSAMATSAANATSVTLTGLTPNKTYFVIVHARDGAGNSDSNNVQRSGSTLVDSVAPTFAGASSVDSATLTTLRVNWAQATDAGTPQAGISYDVCYSTVSNACKNGGFSAMASVTGVSSYTTPSSLTPGTPYYFVVRSKDGSGNSDGNNVQVSGSTTADTTAPTGGVASSVSNATSTSLRINFTQATDNWAGSNIYYRICYTSSAAAPTCTTNFAINYGATVTNTPLFLTVSNLIPDTTYNFVVRAEDSDGNISTNTTVASGTTSSDTSPPVWVGGPTLAYYFTGSAMSQSAFTIGWTQATDAQWPSNGVSDIRYQLCVSTLSSGCAGLNFVGQYTTGYGATSYNITGLSRRTYYYVWARAQNRSGYRDTGDHMISAQSATSFANDIQPIINGCNAVCHAWNYGNMVNQNSFQTITCYGAVDYIEPDYPYYSFLWRKLYPDGMTTSPFNAFCPNDINGGSQMPLGGPYNYTNASIIYDWILGQSGAIGDGAPNN